MRFKNKAPLTFALLASTVLAFLAYREWRVPLAVLSALRQADKGVVCEMKPEMHGNVREHVLSGKCVELRPEDLRTIGTLTRGRIFWNPIKSRTEGVCADFVSPDSEIRITSKAGDMSIQINDDRCWMVLSHALGVIQITNPELVKAMPNFISVLALREK